MKYNQSQKANHMSSKDPQFEEHLINVYAAYN